MTDTNEAQAAQKSVGDFSKFTGLAIVERLFDGSLNPSPMVKLLPFTLLRPEPGKIELHATPDERVLNLTKTVHGGWIMMMLDTAMSLAALTTLEPGEVGSVPLTEATGAFRGVEIDHPLRDVARKSGITLGEPL